MIVRIKEQILGAALNRLVRETDITVTSPGGVARTWFEIIAEELSYDFRLMDANLSSLFISTAGGEALDRLGTLFGVTRVASTSAIDKNEGRVYFYLNSMVDHEAGTSDIDASSAITIPAGTLISTDTVGLGVNPQTWRTTAQAVIGVGAHMTFVSVEPVYNTVNSIGAGTARYHNLDPESYPQVYVMNRMDLEVREDIESDGNYRFRIVNAINEAAKGNMMSLRLAALGTPGVRDCKVLPLAYGVGTAKVIVVLDAPGTTAASSAFIDASFAVKDNASAGDLIFVERPSEVMVDINAIVVGDVSASGRAAIASNISRYIAGLSVGDPISSAKITNEAISSSVQVKDFAIMEGGFMLNGTPKVFTRIDSLGDEQFYPGTINIYLANPGLTQVTPPPQE